MRTAGFSSDCVHTLNYLDMCNLDQKFQLRNWGTQSIEPVSRNTYCASLIIPLETQFVSLCMKEQARYNFYVM